MIALRMLVALFFAAVAVAAPFPNPDLPGATGTAPTTAGAAAAEDPNKDWKH
jgi:hypothetical protein